MATARERLESEEPTPLRRTVTPPYRSRPNAAMNAIGWLIFAGVLILLVPLGPLLLALWALSRRQSRGT